VSWPAAASLASPPSAAPPPLPSAEDAARAAAAWAASQRAAALASRASAASRKAREVYVGNILPGVVNGDTLRTFFDAALSGLPGSAGGTPVVAVQPASDGKYAFVELRHEDLATAALSLSGMELVGRAISVARPAGYLDALAAAAAAAAAMAAAAGMAAGMQGAAGAAVGMMAAPAAAVPTACVRLENLVTLAELRDDAEYEEARAPTRPRAPVRIPPATAMRFD
jgi:splicing factor U2AF subunit